MADEAELNSYIIHFTKPELKVVWGKPDESSTMEDIWYINDNTKSQFNHSIKQERPI